MRDLWAYQLAISPIPSPSIAIDPTFSDTDASSSEHEEGNGELSDDDSLNDRSDKSDEEPLVDPDLLVELSDRSKSPDGAMDEPEEQRRDARWRRRRRLRAVDTIVTLVVALWIIRYPLANVDMEE